MTCRPSKIEGKEGRRHGLMGQHHVGYWPMRQSLFGARGRDFLLLRRSVGPARQRGQCVWPPPPAGDEKSWVERPVVACAVTSKSAHR
ncbi:hypothetical protein BHE74_00040741 [Ensete ventricosum]|nr:hypothetical protein BHE74_00040741 [Ensete ventricosum]